ncbi:MAG: hypothetical protein GX303_07965 [Clostridiales bacterium]|nr:hypothetical protein [Clostridiales bacterium]
MSFQNERYILRLATPDDAAGIKKVFESGEFPGGISVQFLRGEDPLLSLQRDGDRAVIPIAVDRGTDEIIGVGACIIQRAYLNGDVKKVGYLTGLKLLPQYHRKVSIIPKAYNFLYQATKDDVDVYYTTILSDNLPAQKMLEKKRRFMPEYRYIGDYTVYCMGTSTGRNNLDIESGNIEGLDAFYDEHLPKHNLSPINRNLFGLSDRNFYTLRRDGEILLACAVWNQQDYKQYLLKSYSGIYKLLSKLPTKYLGYPPFPNPNKLINYASIALFCARDDVDDKTTKEFLEKVKEKNRNYDLLFFGVFEDSKYKIILDKIKHVKYKSRLYEVKWEGATDKLQKPINLEVGLL